MAIQTLYVDRKIADSPQVNAIVRRLDLTPEIVSDTREVYHSVSAAADPVKMGKSVLYLTYNRGAFIKNCPGTRSYTCCGYQILHVGTYCDLDCTYCILQSYFHPPVLQYFVNHSDLFKELETAFADNTIHRLGTGEFTDSLIWELWTDLSNRLVPAFAAQNSAVLELKTKTTAIDRLEPLAKLGLHPVPQQVAGNEIRQGGADGGGEGHHQGSRNYTEDRSGEVIRAPGDVPA